jgi:hypothetical protein
MIKLIIGERIYPKAPSVHVFELVTTGMSGDADAYKDNSFTGTYDEIAVKVGILEVISRYDSWNEAKIVEALQEHAEAIGLDYRVLHNFWVDAVGGDVTNEGSLAALEGYQVFWYNQIGEKFKVDVQVI